MSIVFYYFCFFKFVNYFIFISNVCSVVKLVFSFCESNFIVVCFVNGVGRVMLVFKILFIIFLNLVGCVVYKNSFVFCGWCCFFNIW